MQLLYFPELFLLQLLLILLSIYWFLRRNDQLPLLITGFLFYCGSYRYFAVTQGWARGWVRLQTFGFNAITEAEAERVLLVMVLGELCLLGSYLYTQRQKIPVLTSDLLPTEHRLLSWLRPRLLILSGTLFAIALYTQTQVLRQIQAGRSLGFQVSAYLYLLPLALVGIAILLLCVWKRGGFASGWSRLLAVTLLVSLAQFTFGPAGRFQFMGWLIAASVIVSSNYRPRTRLWILLGFAAIALSLFAIAGTLRNTDFTDINFRQSAWERAFSAEDANMLDGFVLLQQVYPERLSYSFGGEHLEILLRPIPRTLWPNKPVGGYMNKLGLITAETGFNLGISPTLFGSCYAEGGIWGVVLFASGYGWVLARLMRTSAQVLPFAGLLIRALLCAALVPLLRGGDLPGIYAWIGMAFWPCGLVLWLKRRLIWGPMSQPSSPLPTPYSTPHR